MEDFSAFAHIYNKNRICVFIFLSIENQVRLLQHRSVAIFKY